MSLSAGPDLPKRRCSVDSLLGKSRWERRKEEKGRANEEETRLVAVAAAAAAAAAAAEEANAADADDDGRTVPFNVAALCQGCCRAAAAPLKLFFKTKEQVELHAAATEFEAARPLAAALTARNMAIRKRRREEVFFFFSSSTTSTSTLFCYFLEKKARKGKEKKTSSLQK